MERKKILNINRVTGKRKTEEFLLRSVMAFTLLHQPVMSANSNADKSTNDTSKPRYERILQVEDNSPGDNLQVVVPLASSNVSPLDKPADRIHNNPSHSPQASIDSRPERLNGFMTEPSPSESVTVFNAKRRRLVQLNSTPPLEQILYNLENSSQVLENISNKELNMDIEMYYPIIKPIADTFGLPWQIMMVTIEEESHASRSETAFSKANYPIQGIAQINQLIYGEDIAEARNKFRKYASFPQRHPGDWIQIGAGYKIIKRNYDQYIGEGLGETTALYYALKIYTGSADIASFRLKQIEALEGVTPGT